MRSYIKILERAWWRGSLWFLPLLPLSWLYRLIPNRAQIQQNGVPVWVIGNISVGGSGKTPTIIALCDILRQKGVRVGVIARGYGGSNANANTPLLLNAQTPPSVAGDEPCLIYQSATVPVAVCVKRHLAYQALVDAHTLDVVLADDGLQNPLPRTQAWAVVDSVRGFGRGWLLPAGFLRESVHRLHYYQTLWHGQSHSQALAFARQFYQNHANDVQIATMVLMPVALSRLDDWRQGSEGALDSVQGDVYMLCAIGNPQRFMNTLQGLGLSVRPIIFADHHAYTLDDFSTPLDLPIILSEKDAVKACALPLDDSVRTRIWVLKVRADFNDVAHRWIEDFCKRHLSL